MQKSLIISGFLIGRPVFLHFKIIALYKYMPLMLYAALGINYFGIWYRISTYASFSES